MSEAEQDGAADTIDDVRNLDETARFFDVSVNTVKAWIGDGCPVVQRGANGVAYQLSLRQVAEWRDGLRREAEEDAARKLAAENQLRLELGGILAPPDMAAGAGSNARLRKEVIEAELQEMKLARERGELIPFDRVASWVARAGRVFAASVQAIPDQIADEFGFEDAVALAMRAKIEAALNDLADNLGNALKPEVIEEGA